jgi:SAM-dependent methyltransferase
MQKETHWEDSSSWYDRIVGAKGHYYHETVILPRLLAHLKGASSVLDLACGQGVLARHLPRSLAYVGVDGSPSLIAAAKRYSTHPFHLHDLSKPLTLQKRDFSHITLILAAQNFAELSPVFTSAHAHLQKDGLFLLVLNHPLFRIPRQSSWGVDEAKKLQYRRVDRYLSPLSIPIQTHPSLGEKGGETLSFHRPLSTLVTELTRSGFVLSGLEEWCSDRKSVGKMATMENRSRQEFPLFMTLIAKKL